MSSSSSILDHTLALVNMQIKKQEDSYSQAAAAEPHFSINQTVYYLTGGGQIIPSTVVQILYFSDSKHGVHYWIKPVEDLSWLKRVQTFAHVWLEAVSLSISEYRNQIPFVCFPRHAVTAGDEIFKTLAEACERLLLNDARRSLTNLVESKILDAHPHSNEQQPLTISDIGAADDQVYSI